MTTEVSVADRTVRVTLRRSLIGEKPKTRATVDSLGLRKINQSREHIDTPSLQGMLAKVRHLVEVEEVRGRHE